MKNNRVKLSIVYDNNSKPGFKSGWGFSCLVEVDNKKILFDTGCEGHGLLYNLNKLENDTKNIDIIVLSHQHWDHTGGLFDLLELNNNVEVFALESFSKHLKGEIRKRAKLKEVNAKQKIIDNVYTTGLISNDPDEQSLILETTKGVIVIVGCSHPGVDKILGIAKDYGKIYAIIGGFHGFNKLDFLEGIAIIGACHCTQHIQEIKERFPKQFREIKAGDVIEI